MARWNRLKRWVAPGLRLVAGGRRLRPDAGSRLYGLVTLAGQAGRATMAELIALAWPIAAGMLGETALGLCDTKLVGALGAAALGRRGDGGGRCSSSATRMVFGLMRGVKVRTAYAVGEGRPADAVRYGQAGALLGAAVGVAIWALSRDVTPVLHALGLEESMVPYARDFVAARSWGAVGTCAAAALIQYLQGVGESRTADGGGHRRQRAQRRAGVGADLRPLRAAGAGRARRGYATAATEMLELAALLVAVRGARARGRSRGRRSGSAPRCARWRGWACPPGLHFLVEMMAFMTFTAILGSFGAAQMAAHQIAFNTIRASFLPGVAVAEAASVLVARSLGERRLDEADRATHASLALGVGFMTLCGVVFALFGASLAGAFADDPEVIRVARRLFLVAAVFQTLDAVNIDPPRRPARRQGRALGRRGRHRGGVDLPPGGGVRPGPAPRVGRGRRVDGLRLRDRRRLGGLLAAVVARAVAGAVPQSSARYGARAGHDGGYRPGARGPRWQGGAARSGLRLRDPALRAPSAAAPRPRTAPRRPPAGTRAAPEPAADSAARAASASGPTISKCPRGPLTTPPSLPGGSPGARRSVATGPTAGAR